MVHGEPLRDEWPQQKGVADCMDSERTQHPEEKFLQWEKSILKEIFIASYGYGTT